MSTHKTSIELEKILEQIQIDIASAESLLGKNLFESDFSDINSHLKDDFSILENQKEDLNKAQTEVYSEFSKTNEENMLKLNKLFSEKEENSEKISDLAKIIKTYIKENELYKKETQEDLKSTNQKIGKIN